jgi:OOP family OmpA-OmpF porin
MRRLLTILLFVAASVAAASAAAQDQAAAPPGPPPLTVCSPGPYIVFFASGSARLRPDPLEILDHALEVRRAGCGTGLVVVAGYTDRSGRASRNLVLSRRRAAAVAHYLGAHGIPQRMMIVQGFGDRRPWNGARNRTHEPENRRVEVIFGPPTEDK